MLLPVSCQYNGRAQNEVAERRESDGVYTFTGPREADVRIAVGADEENEVTTAVVEELRERGHYLDVLAPEQWPDVAHKVAEEVATGKADQGMLFCWTGTGTAMAANKVPGVRAALAWEPWIAEGARRWNDANVLVMSFKRTTPEAAREIVGAWLGVGASDPDEADNIARLAEIERKYAK
jgi:ribose 5-phosphate isomerase B